MHSTWRNLIVRMCFYSGFTTAILSYGLLCLICSCGAAATDIGWEIKPLKETIAPGEACVLEVVFKNSTPKDRKINLGYDGAEAFEFSILDESRSTLVSGGRISGSGISRVGSRVIPGNGIHSEYVILNRWCGTHLPAGRYLVESRCYIAEQPLASTFTLVIDPSLEEAMKADLAMLLPEPRSNYGVGSIRRIEILSYTNHPAVVPYLVEGLRMESLIEPNKLELIEAFGRVDHVDSVKALIDFIESATKKTARPLLDCAKYVLCELHKASKNESVREATGLYFETHPCEKRPTGWG